MKKSIFENKVSLRRSLKYIKEAKRVLEADEVAFDDIKEDDDDLNEDELFEEGDKPAAEKKMTEEELKIEALKIATNIAKLMSNVTPNDIMSISSTVADFIRNHEIGSGEDLNFSDTTEDDTNDDSFLDNTEEEKDEESEEGSKEDEEK